MSVLELPSQVAALERRIAALEVARAPAPPDQLNPNVFTINAQGQIEENLAGKLTAQGIVFTEAPSGQTTNTIVWNAPGGPVEAIYGWLDEPTKHTLQIESGTPLHNAQLKLTGDVAGHGKLFVSADNAFGATLLDGEGKSSFLQLATAARTQLVFGISQVEWVAKGFESTYAAIATPFANTDAWFGFPITGLANATMGSGGNEPFQVQFIMRTSTELAAGAKQFFSYFIIGH